jgi:hypothetical protein
VCAIQVAKVQVCCGGHIVAIVLKRLEEDGCQCADVVCVVVRLYTGLGKHVVVFGQVQVGCKHAITLPVGMVEFEGHAQGWSRLKSRTCSCKGCDLYSCMYRVMHYSPYIISTVFPLARQLCHLLRSWYPYHHRIQVIRRYSA